MDKEPERYYDWMLWKLKKEKKKEKPIEDRIVGISAGAGGRNISEEFNMGKPISNATTIDFRDVVRHLNRIEAKIDLLLSKSDGGLK